MIFYIPESLTITLLCMGLMKVTLYFAHVNGTDIDEEEFSQYIEWGDTRKIYNLCQQFSMWNSRRLTKVSMEGKKLLHKEFTYDPTDDLVDYQKHMDSTVPEH